MGRTNVGPRTIAVPQSGRCLAGNSRAQSHEWRYEDQILKPAMPDSVPTLSGLYPRQLGPSLSRLIPSGPAFPTPAPCRPGQGERAERDGAGIWREEFDLSRNAQVRSSNLLSGSSSEALFDFGTRLDRGPSRSRHRRRSGDPTLISSGPHGGRGPCGLASTQSTQVMPKEL